MRTPLLLTLLMLFAPSAPGFDRDAALAAIDAGRAADAVPALAEAANAGEPAAATLLASLYQRGEGVARNLERAAELYAVAARAGDAEAQFNLANMYLLGEGVEPDEAWALTWYRAAADQGHALAARNLGQLYRAAGVSEAETTPAAADALLAQVREEPRVNEVAAVDGPASAAPVAAVRDDDEHEALRIARAAGLDIAEAADPLEAPAPRARPDAVSAAPRGGQDAAPAAAVVPPAPPAVTAQAAATEHAAAAVPTAAVPPVAAGGASAEGPGTVTTPRVGAIAAGDPALAALHDDAVAGGAVRPRAALPGG